MSFFEYRGDDLYAESVPLRDIAAQFGTPCYVYSHAALTAAFQDFEQGFASHPHLICYAVKANSNLALLNLFARLGAGFDIVSGGELQRAIAAGGDPGKIVFSGVGKSALEMHQALSAGIRCFNVESESELLRLNQVAGEMRKIAPVSLRVNPNVDPKTHPYISTGLKESKFGVAYTDALQFYRNARNLPHLHICGIGCHIGSQITEVAPFVDALNKILDLIDLMQSEDIHISHLDIGGGVGIRYHDENPPAIADYARTLLEQLSGRKMEILLEPGRALVGNSALLLTKVEYLKHGASKNFAIVDAAMNDLIRPALYDAYHHIIPVRRDGNDEAQLYEIVGPVCESGDFLGHDRTLCLAEGDLLSIMSAGAYGMSMSSNYNTRPRAAEVMIDKNQVHVIRDREKIEALFAQEHLLP